MSNDWIDKPDRPGVWVDTGASRGHVTASIWIEAAVREYRGGFSRKFKYIGPIPDAPLPPASDAEIAAAARTFVAAEKTPSSLDEYRALIDLVRR